MPTYTYKCDDCKERFTRLTKMDERDNVSHECGQRATRLIDRPGSVWAPTSTGGGHK